MKKFFKKEKSFDKGEMSEDSSLKDAEVASTFDEMSIEDDKVSASYKSSLFSNNDSFSTTPSSKPSSRQRTDNKRKINASLGQIDESSEMSSFFFKEDDNNNKFGGFLSDDIGRPLRVINADLYNELNTSPPSRRISDNEMTETTDEFDVDKNLKILNENLNELVDQLKNDSINISKATVSIIELLEKFKFNNYKINENNMNLKILLKFFLQFHDYYLRFKVYLNSRKLIIRKFIEFLKKLGLDFDFDSNSTVPYLQNFAIPIQDNSASILKVEKILNKISNSSSTIISDQEGSFIAPILRGLTKTTSIISIMFGIPDPQPEHYEIINIMYQTFPEIHFFIIKDVIKPCNDTSNITEEKLLKFKPPFKLPTFNSPEISISISSENSLKSSGTLGCFLKPNIPSDLKDSNLLKYKGLKFALTCAHVLLSEMTNKKDSEELYYPLVQCPSKVLVNSYKNALIEQRDKYSNESVEFKSFNNEITQCNENYNLQLGQVIWGERILIHNKISDIAIIKLNENLNSKITNSFNSEEQDLPLHLNFKNSKIVKIIPKSKFQSHSKVFKIGTSTNYTTGSINGIKMIYWLEGHLQTSEFVVSSSNTFANSGDSGSLILNDLNDQFGLGAIGMLHSFDGESKQLGLFSTLEDIVGRLNDVTGVEWDLV